MEMLLSNTSDVSCSDPIMDFSFCTRLTPAYQNRICCPQPKDRGRVAELWLGHLLAAQAMLQLSFKGQQGPHNDLMPAGFHSFKLQYRTLSQLICFKSGWAQASNPASG